MTCGPEAVALPPGARVVMREETRAMLVGERGPELVVCGVAGAFRDLAFASGAAAKSLKEFGEAWDGVARRDHVHRVQDGGVALFDHQTRTMKLIEPQPPATRSCPYCGMLNPPGTIECGAGRWNGCGAPLRRQ